MVIRKDFRLIGKVVAQAPKCRDPEDGQCKEPQHGEPKRIAPSQMHEFVREDCFELIGREPVHDITRNQDQRTNPSHSESRTGKPWDHPELGQVQTHTSR